MNDKMREAFERIALVRCKCDLTRSKHFPDMYESTETQVAWVMYQAGQDERTEREQAALQEWVSEMQHTVDSFKRRIDLLEKAQRFMSEPSRTIVCDILANGSLLPDSEGKRYGIDLRVAIKQLQEQNQ